jgi:hypothetical protein
VFLVRVLSIFAGLLRISIMETLWEPNPTKPDRKPYSTDGSDD